MAIAVITLTIVFYFVASGEEVLIDKDAHNVLQAVLKEFDKDPENPRFNHVVLTSDPDCKSTENIHLVSN